MGKSPDSSERHATRFTILVSPTFLFCSLFPKKPFLHQPSSAMVTSCLYLYFTSLLHLPTSRHPSRAQSKAISPRTPRTVPRTPRLPRYSTYSHTSLFLLPLHCLPPSTQEAPPSICREAHLYTQGWTFLQGSRPTEGLPRVLPKPFPLNQGPAHPLLPSLLGACSQ